VIQRFILYLGHPSHATTVVLSSMLLGAGLGAMTSRRVDGRGIAGWGAGLIAVLAISNLTMGSAFQAAIGWPWLARAGFCFALSLAMGFFMGFALPLGMVRFGERSKAWFWAVNGAAGVFASVSTLALVIALGFARVMALGTAVYALAAVVLLLAPRDLRPDFGELTQAPRDPRS
jgi:hypothetical protein